jgi:hypothetical protein
VPASAALTESGDAAIFHDAGKEVAGHTRQHLALVLERNVPLIHTFSALAVNPHDHHVVRRQIFEARHAVVTLALVARRATRHVLVFAPDPRKVGPGNVGCASPDFDLERGNEASVAATHIRSRQKAALE